MAFTAIRRALRESVAVGDLPQLERGTDEDDDAKAKAAKKRAKKNKRRKTSESVALTVRIREANVSRSGKAYEATVIREGKGNPGDKHYYTAQALQKAVREGLFEGLQAYLNHPTPSEERERPERDVRYLAGHFREARFVPGTPAEVRAKFVPGGMDRDRVVQLIESTLDSPQGRPLIGISIDGYGDAPDSREIDGRTYHVVRELVLLGSADLVTRTATGGRFHRRLQEAWHRIRPAKEPHGLGRALTRLKLRERNYTTEQRVQLAKAGHAIPVRNKKGEIVGGRYPIKTTQDVHNAINDANRTSAGAEEKAHIAKNAKRLRVKLPKTWRAREATKSPAAQAGTATSKEVRMKPAKLQEQIRGAVAKLEEASTLDEKESDRADELVTDALGVLRECATVEVKSKVKVREVEKPVAASEEDKDQLAAELETTKTKLQEAETARDEERSRRKGTDTELKTLKRGISATKILREAEVPEALARDWFDEIAQCKDEDAMKGLVERKQAAANAQLDQLRESIGIEGNPARQPALVGDATPTGGLLDRMGIDRDELAAA